MNSFLISSTISTNLFETSSSGSMVAITPSSFGEFETFEIRHTSYSRNVFAEGALKAVKYIYGKQQGLYNMDDIVN